jgi:microsomal epoxide hydrolase
MIYWVTNSIGSANRYYYEAAHDTSFIPSPGADGSGKIQVPTAMAVFPKDLLPTPRSLGERWFDLRRWTEMPRGGHFAALEEPALLVEDIREFFRPLR